MRVLLIGAFGYLGANLAKYLIKSGNQVVLSSRNPRILSIQMNGSSYEIIDFFDKENLNSITKEIDLIIYAGGMSAEKYKQNSQKLIQVRKDEVKALADAAVKNMVSQIIYLSTIHVYSSPLCGSISENTPLKNLHPYALAHRGSEDALFEAVKGSATRAIVLRLTNMFGVEVPYDDNIWGLVVHDFCRSAATLGQIKINSFAKAEQRDFMSVNELCRLIGYILKNKNNFKNGAYNVASGRSITILELAQLIKKISSKSFNLSPSINLSLVGSQIIQKKLIIDTSKLLSTGYKINDNLENEIKNVLKQCYEMFKQFP